MFQRELVRVAALLSIGLLFRALYLYDLLDTPFFLSPRLDGLFHDRWALSIASGNILGDDVFFRAPFYPYLLGLAYSLFGHDYLIPRIIQFLLGSFAIALLYSLGKRIFGEWPALIGAFFFAIYPVEIYFEGELLLESILGFLCVAFLLLAYKAEERPGTAIVFLAGFSLGILAITRPPLLPVGLALVLYLTYVSSATQMGFRLAAKSSSLFLSGLLIPIVIVTGRNYAVGDDLVFISSQGGVNFYIGNNPEADGYSSSMPSAGFAVWENRDVSYTVEKELGYAPKPSEESLFWYRKGFEFIVERPLDFVVLTARKAYLFWNHHEIPNNQSYYFARQFSSLLMSIPIGFGIIVPLGLVGMALSWKNLKSKPVALFILLYFLITILFFVCDRYRVPVFPLLCLYSGVTIVGLFTRIRGGEYKGAGLIILGCVAVGLFSNASLPEFTETDTARDHMAVGITQLEAGDHAAARVSFAKVDSIRPDYPNIHLYLADIDWSEGRRETSVEHLRRDLSLNSESFPAMINLAFIYFNSSRLDSALYFGERAVRKKPYVSAGYTIVAQTLLRMNEVARAESILTRGAKECGQDFIYGEYLLAGIRLKKGDHEAAETGYRSSLKRLLKSRQPQYEPEFSFSTAEKTGLSDDELRCKMLYGLGSVHVFRDQIDSAVVYFSAATTFCRNDPDPWADLGVALMRLREFEKASDALSVAIGLDSLNHLYWFNRGTALANLNHLTEAKASFERCLVLNPAFQPALSGLALVTG